MGVNFRYLLGYYLELHLAVGSIAWYAALVLLMTMLAGYGAARAATTGSVLRDIRSE